mgnify:CR=1 FL=1
MEGAFKAWEEIGYTKEECGTKWQKELIRIATSAQHECDTMKQKLSTIQAHIDSLKLSLSRGTPKHLQAVSSCSLRDQLRASQNILDHFQSLQNQLKSDIGTKHVRINKLSEKLEIEIEDEYVKKDEVTRERDVELDDKVQSLKTQLVDRQQLLEVFVQNVNVLIRELNICSNATQSKLTASSTPGESKQEVSKQDDEAEADIEKNNNIDYVPMLEIQLKDIPFTVESFAVLNDRRFQLESKLREFRRLKKRGEIENCRDVYGRRRDNEKIVKEEEFREKMRKLSSSANRKHQIEYKEMRSMTDRCQPKVKKSKNERACAYPCISRRCKHL